MSTGANNTNAKAREFARSAAAHRLLIRRHGELLAQFPGATLRLEEGLKEWTEDEAAALLVGGASVVWVAREKETDNFLGKVICYAGGLTP